MNKNQIGKPFKGVIIEESLENKDVLKNIRIISTEVEKVTDRHKTPWISQWTLHSVEIPDNEAADVAREISKALDSKQRAIRRSKKVWNLIGYS